MKKQTLLLVDPDDGARDALAELLRDAGYSVLEARDGSVGFRMALEWLPGLVIVEPWPSCPASVRVVERLRSAAATRHVPVLALTTAAAPEHRTRALAAGCADYLEKPCPPERVLRVVRRILGPAPSGAAADRA